MKYALLLLMLSGCAGSPVYTPKQVDVPVEVPCRVSAPVPPDFAVLHVDAGASMVDKVKAALSELEQRKAYEDQLLAAATACS